MSKTDGGPAFPMSKPHSVGGGMTLRDWFAGQAMRGCLWDDDMEHNHRTVTLCFQIADAMLKAREDSE